ncbi:MAG TPA: alpha/beta hydrolase [Acidimicrobiales bacterium]|nr:alpha/beta hydrolase [Acidimicrobiales bacterium]
MTARRSPAGRRTVAWLVAAALAAACTGASDDRAEPTPSSSSTTAAPRPTTTTEPPTTTTTVALPPPVPIDWAGCGGGFQCATVAVPVDYADPGGATLELALIRRPAGSPDRRIGTLLVNPGGPGASGVRRVRRGFTISAEVADRFDIVGFDPRGVGDSTPVSCGSTVAAFRGQDLDPDTPDEARALDAAARAVADECASTEGDRLGHLGTVEVVHDIEVIRRDLGEVQISFVGLSYGTLIALLWADAYPGSVRAAVLDGVVDPAAGGDPTALSQMKVIDEAVRAMDDACAADSACPLTQQGLRLLAAYDELARRVETGEVAGHGVGPTQLVYAAFSATYGQERWPLLWQAVSDGLAGDLRGVADMAAWFTGLVTFAPFALVTCLDSTHPVGFAEWEHDADLAARLSPRFGRTAANELLPCAYWPAATRVPHSVEAAGAPPILVLGSTGDVATPYEQAQAVARRLRSGALLTVDDAGHVAIGSSSCVGDAVTRYLVDLTVPTPGARC